MSSEQSGLRDFADKVILVAGGTGGVGFRAAEIFARRGARVVVNGRDPDRGAQAIEALRKITFDVRFEAADLTDPDGFAGVVDRTVAAYGGIDVLVSAGAEGKLSVRLFSDFEPDQFSDALLSRFLPRVIPVHAVLPTMRRRGGGSIVLLTTDAARHVTNGESIVGSAGAGVILLTKSLGRELAQDGIRVNSVAMTITSDTPSWERIFAEGAFASRLFDKAVSRFPFGRPPTATEVADVVVFFASPAASQVTGQTLSVNGGLSFGGW